VTDGGMHHHLAATGNLGQILKRDYPIVAPERMNETALAPATVVGPLCTPLDTLAREALLPQLGVGDLIAVLQSGAYGLTASPAGFLSHPPPAEVLVENGAFAVL
jgi:diaminopimelate decarboxylase